MAALGQFETRLLYPWERPFLHRRAVRLTCVRLVRRLPATVQWRLDERDEGVWVTMTWPHERAYRVWAGSDALRAWKGESHVAQPRMFVGWRVETL